MVGISAGIAPLVAFLLAGLSEEMFYVVAGVNLLGWALVSTLFMLRNELRRSLARLAVDFGLGYRFRSFESLAHAIVNEFERRNGALLTNLLERRISSKEELSRTLERIVGHAFRLLNAESAELALFDKELGLYHSSFVLGKPFRKSSQAMLSGALEGGDSADEASPDVLMHPLAFGGSILGSLRVGLKRGSIPTVGDREIIRLLALQGSLAIINAQYTEELMRMRRSSEETIKAKTGFLANLSHEIRGPLGIMLNAVELVLDGLCGPVNADQLETLSMVKSNGSHLLELINDVLDYAKVESGKMLPNKEEILVVEMLRDLAAVVRGQADAKSHTITVRGSDEALTISADRRHMRQMLINMLTNAIKYTPEKGTIELWAERIPGKKVKISVKDNGVGIDPSDRKKVFSPFERIDNSYSVNQLGTGLGMSLTKRLAEVNSGSIDFASQPDKGSHFWLTFPSVEYSPTASRGTKEEAPVARGNGELILLVERDPGERDMLVRYLAHLGYRVIAHSNRVDVLDTLRQGDIQLAIIDNNVLDNNEEVFIREIRERAESSRLPIVLLSSRAFVFDIEKYLKIGVDRCLSKPVTLKELGAICRTLLDGDTLKSQQGESPDSGKGEVVHTRIIRAEDILH